MVILTVVTITINFKLHFLKTKNHRKTSNKFYFFVLEIVGSIARHFFLNIK